MTECVPCHREPERRGDPLALDNRPELSLLSCHREGVARGDPLWTGKRTANSRYAYFETRWIAASLPLVAPRNDTTVELGTFTTSCHREGEARGDPLGTKRRTAPPSYAFSPPKKAYCSDKLNHYLICLYEN